MKTDTKGWYDLAGNGGYAITRDLSEEEVIQLSRIDDLESIAPKVDTQPLSNNTWSLLDKHVFSKNPKVRLTVSKWAKTETDISFLACLPNLKRFSFHLPKLQSFDGLESLNNNLEELSLSETDSKKPSLSILRNFKNLRKLTIGNTKKGIEAISELKNLEKLWLASTTWPSYEHLANLPKLWWINVVFGGTTNLKHFGEFKALRYLEMWQVRKMSDISPLGEVSTLECLSLGGMKHVERLPSFKNLSKLRSIHLEKMSGITDMNPLLEASGLVNLLLISSGHLDVHHLSCLKKHPSLQRVRIGLGSDKKNNTLKELLNFKETLSPYDPLIEW